MKREGIERWLMVVNLAIINLAIVNLAIVDSSILDSVIHRYDISAFTDQ